MVRSRSHAFLSLTHEAPDLNFSPASRGCDRRNGSHDRGSRRFAWRSRVLHQSDGIQCGGAWAASAKFQQCGSVRSDIRHAAEWTQRHNIQRSSPSPRASAGNSALLHQGIPPSQRLCSIPARTPCEIGLDLHRNENKGGLRFVLQHQINFIKPMISNERSSHRGQYSFGARPPNPQVNEDTLKSEKIQIERKMFILMLRENPRGRFLRITEDVNGRRDSIIIPSTGLDEFCRCLRKWSEPQPLPQILPKVRPRYDCSPSPTQSPLNSRRDPTGFLRYNQLWFA
jgi:hypothetical protein